MVKEETSRGALFCLFMFLDYWYDSPTHTILNWKDLDPSYPFM